MLLNVPLLQVSLTLSRTFFSFLFQWRVRRWAFGVSNLHLIRVGYNQELCRGRWFEIFYFILDPLDLFRQVTSEGRPIVFIRLHGLAKVLSNLVLSTACCLPGLFLGLLSRILWRLSRGMVPKERLQKFLWRRLQPQGLNRSLALND